MITFLKNFFYTRAWPIMIGLAIAAMLAGGGWWLYAERAVPIQPAGEVTADKLSVPDLLERIARFVAINRQEDPLVATVNQPDVLREQSPAFYKDAHIGDRLVVWSDQAVLYSERQDKIVALLKMQAPTSATGSAVMPAAAKWAGPMIEVRNGTTDRGLAKELTAKLQTAGFTTLAPRDADRSDYASTTLAVYGDQDYSADLTKLLTILSAVKVPSLTDEKNIGGNIVIVIGADYLTR